MADHKSLSSHWARSPAQVAGLEPQPDSGCRLLTVDHGHANAPAGAVHTVDSRYTGSLFGECGERGRVRDAWPVAAHALANRRSSRRVSKGSPARNTCATPGSGRLDRFLARHPDATTPFLVVDLDVVRRQYVSLTAALPGTEVFYAVKANPATQTPRSPPSCSSPPRPSTITSRPCWRNRMPGSAWSAPRKDRERAPETG